MHNCAGASYVLWQMPSDSLYVAIKACQSNQASGLWLGRYSTPKGTSPNCFIKPYSTCFVMALAPLQFVYCDGTRHRSYQYWPELAIADWLATAQGYRAEPQAAVQNHMDPCEFDFRDRDHDAKNMDPCFLRLYPGPEISYTSLWRCLFSTNAAESTPRERLSGRRSPNLRFSS
jgi:hypothetical protein